MQVDEKMLLECNSEDDCPAKLPNCNHMSNSTPTGKTGYCVPDSCQQGQRKSKSLRNHLAETLTISLRSFLSLAQVS